MDKIPTLGFAVFAGVCCGLWPLMIGSGRNPIMTGIMVIIVSLAVFLPFLPANFKPAELTAQAVVIILAAGVINGFGSIAIQHVAVSKEKVTGILVLIITQVVVTAVGGLIFYAERFTFEKFVGLIAAVAAIKLLTGK